MDKDSTRNTIIFMGFAFVLMMLYQAFVLAPIAKRREAEIKARSAQVATQPLQPGGAPSQFVPRDQALAQSPRVAIDTPALKGSIDLKGGRVDDLYLKGYPETLAKGSPPVELLRPEGAPLAYFADFGWAGAPGADQAVWTTPAGAVLSVGHPVTLTYDNGRGLVFTRTVAVDDKFMFTVTNAVTNRGTAPVTLAPYASVQRQGMPKLTPVNIIHEGAVGALGANKPELQLIPYKDWKKKGDTAIDSKGGWVGLTDKYWLTAVAPDQTEAVKGSFRVNTVNGIDVYEANYLGAARTLAPGATTSETSHLFAGAKKVSILNGYKKSLGIPRFDDAVDWGFLWFLTKPVFLVLEQIYKLAGNFGLAILGLTVLVKLLLFPLANRSFASMSKMKTLQPELEAIKKRFPDDPARQQQETMALYQREKVNPLAGCLPVLIQIPIFYSLYKVLYVTIEMRHAPFFGWIRDLSAPDPTSWGNLFGLLPYHPANVPLIGGLLSVGVWPLLYGLTQWLTTQMNPQPTADPTQKLLFQLFPVVFTFMLAQSPSGLLIYWTWSSILTIVQQYVIMHRYGAANPIDDMLAKLRGGAKAKPA